MTMPEPTDPAEPTNPPEPTDPAEPTEHREPEATQTEQAVAGPTGPAISGLPAPVQPPTRAIDPTGEVFVEPDDEDLSPEEAPKGNALRTAGVVSARAVLGIVCIAVIGATISAASLIALPSVGTSAVSKTIDPVPTSQQLVCPGGLVRIATASGKGANTSSSLGDPSVVGGASPGTVDPSSFPLSDAGTGKTLAAPRRLTTLGSAGSALESGAQSQTVATTEFTGLTSAACASALDDVWLAGGATSVGRTTLLLLANPTDVPATVSVQIFGENGAVTAPGMTGIPVPVGGQRVLSLAGFAPGLVSPVVHVTSTGGQVVANLEQSVTRGLAPGGMDFVGTEANPETTTVIPGVVLAGTAAVQAQLGQNGFDDLQTTLRVYLAGTKPTAVSVSVVSETGATTGKAIRATVQPGVVTDLPLDQLSDGSYTIIVTAKRPLIASVRVSTAGSAKVSPPTDFAWMVAAPLLTSPALVSIAPNMTGAIHFDNPTSKEEDVVLTATDGTSATVKVPAGSAATAAVTAGLTYKLSGYTRLYASVSGVTDGGVTGYVVSPSASGETPIKIYG
jgi:Family of unknown function (DUF5719)